LALQLGGQQHGLLSLLCSVVAEPQVEPQDVERMYGGLRARMATLPALHIK
jgi:hypothetical protein